MTITIRLNADERSLLGKALGILEDIGFTTDKLNGGVLAYLCHLHNTGDNERSVLENALRIIGRIAFVAGVTNKAVLGYLRQVAEIDNNREYHIKEVHSVNKIKASRGSK